MTAADPDAPAPERRRVRTVVRGAVQGVGFRPFVWRLADELALDGWVINDGRGLTAELEGIGPALEQFLERIEKEKPGAAAIESISVDWLEAVGCAGFEIRESDEGGRLTVQVLPEIATCDACRAEVSDPANRRYRYPFTNCTLCGPRFSIVRALPYDRPNTTMAGFPLCAACRAEYEDPADRRFHAQPNACAACGPHLSFVDREGVESATGDDALRAAASALAEGKIVAVKGLGGFHLMVDARDEEAVGRLRDGKPRRDKPFALLVRDLEHAREIARIDETEAEALTSSEAPIVLVERRADAPISDEVAPDNPYLGVMLPYSPLHHLLLEACDFPLVATSGNRSEEPICTDETEARQRLGSIADHFLVHDRPIARHVDDSVTRVLDGELRLLRRARGFAPRPVLLARRHPTILAVGGHLKNTIALGVENRVFLSQHLGDMESGESREAFERVIDDFLGLWEASPVALVHDLHPDYSTTRWAERRGEEGSGAARRLQDARRIAVQHHHAHFAACLAENGHEGDALGVIWDGTGYGPDGTVWGGEFLLGTKAHYRRFASLVGFTLPGGGAAVREPRRSAIALLWEMFGGQALERINLAPVAAFRDDERRLLAGMLTRGVNCPATSSAGRLFDGIAAVLGLGQRSSFEGQAAMRLEHVADPTLDEAYDVELIAPSESPAPWLVDWRPVVEQVLTDLRRGTDVGTISARFHGALVEAISQVAEVAARQTVALSGGCFQNRLLVERTVARLRSDGFQVLLHRHVPPNDGGISLGQVAVAAARLEGGGPADPDRADDGDRFDDGGYFDDGGRGE